MVDDKYTISDVTKDLGFLLSLTKIFEPDAENFWFDPGTGKRFNYQLDNNEDGREIVIFQDPMPRGDYYFFNPFAEGFGRKSPATTLYYRAIRIALNLNISTVMAYVIRSILEAKVASESKDEYSLSHTVVRMSSVPIDRKSTVYDVVDEKMIDEFELLFKRTNDEIIQIPYLTQQMTAKIKCDCLTDSQWDEKFGKDIRKKTLNAFKAVLQGVLGIASPDELNGFTVKYDPELKSSAKLHTTLTVYLKLYHRFNDVIADAFSVEGKPSDRDEINLGELAATIERFPLAYSIAKHMVQASYPKVDATDTVSSDTRGLKIVNEGSRNFGSSRRFPGPEIIDDFGRKTRQPQSLQIGSGPVSTGKFKPHVIADIAVDPFAPAIRTSSTMSSQSNFSTRPGSGGYFSPSPSQSSGFGGGLNLTPSSNFGNPSTRRYF